MNVTNIRSDIANALMNGLLVPIDANCITVPIANPKYATKRRRVLSQNNDLQMYSNSNSSMTIAEDPIFSQSDQHIQTGANEYCAPTQFAETQKEPESVLDSNEFDSNPHEQDHMLFSSDPSMLFTQNKSGLLFAFFLRISDWTQIDKNILRNDDSRNSD